MAGLARMLTKRKLSPSGLRAKLRKFERDHPRLHKLLAAQAGRAAPISLRTVALGGGKGWFQVKALRWTAAVPIEWHRESPGP